MGRLRRVFQRFGTTQQDYAGLFWSHFFAALDWNDAEMWLEGAVQNGWSVSAMRRQRWETLDGTPDTEPQEDEHFGSGDWDDDFVMEADPADEVLRTEDVPIVESADSMDSRERRTAPETPADETEPDGALIYSGEDDAATVHFVRPFDSLEEFPDDLTRRGNNFTKWNREMGAR